MLVKKNNISCDKQELTFLIQSHPSYPILPVIPGFDMNYKIVYSNKGKETREIEISFNVNNTTETPVVTSCDNFKYFFFLQLIKLKFNRLKFTILLGKLLLLFQTQQQVLMSLI